VVRLAYHAVGFILKSLLLASLAQDTAGKNTAKEFVGEGSVP